MNHLHFDCVGGAAGDMIVASLIGLGVPLEEIRHGLDPLPVAGYRIECRPAQRGSFAGLRFEVDVDEGRQPHRSFHAIRDTIRASRLPEPVRARSVAVFERIARAESTIHGIPVDRVHFHEVGAVDSIVDIVAACLALEILAPARVTASAPVVGSGTVECAHGRFPVPSAATLEILAGLTVRQSEEEGERITPTGAAILREVCQAFGPMPPLRVTSIGYGLGARDLPATPNVLRAVLGEAPDPLEADTVAVIETNLDDLEPEILADACERLRDDGALDVYVAPLFMKKGRSGHLLGVICEPHRADEFAARVLALTTAFGVRIHEARRAKLLRSTETVDGPYGPVAIKIGRLGEERVTCSPEYESVRAAAERSGARIKDVYRWALARASRRAEEDTPP